MKISLKEQIDKTWGGVVTDFNCDLKSHEIKITIALNSSKETTYEIIFQEVTAFCFNDSESEAYNNFNWERIEVSSFYAYEENYEVVTDNKNDKLCKKFEANIFLELWESQLFVRAKRITINGLEFQF